MERATIAKWELTLTIDEDVVRRYHDQTSKDPATQEGDWRDFLADVFCGDAADDAGVRWGYIGTDDANTRLTRATRLDSD